METIKVIRQPDGRISLVNKDGIGVLLDNEEDLEVWLSSKDRPDSSWEEDLKDIAKAVHETTPRLQGITKIDAELTRKTLRII